MSIPYEKVFFIGARGEYSDLEFEILGQGAVDYQVTWIQDPEDQSEVGKVFPAVEHYCLSENGQTWFFNISADELYYCRQLSPEEVKSLGFDLPSKSLKEGANIFELHKNHLQQKGAKFREAGIGKLKETKGRATRDKADYNIFDYIDYEYQNKDYSIDVFPNGEVEWFESVYIPGYKITDIFRKTLELENVKAQYLYSQARTWKWIAAVTLLLAMAMPFYGLYQHLDRNLIWEKTETITAIKGQEISFDKFEIPEVGEYYTLEIEAKIPKNSGLNLDFSVLDASGNLEYQGNNEFYHNDSGIGVKAQETTTEKETTLFYPDRVEERTFRFKVIDFGEASKTPTQESIDRIPTIPLTLKIYKGGSNIIWWIFSTFALTLLTAFALYKRTKLKNSVWKY
jgi:hypothetical protein